MIEDQPYRARFRRGLWDSATSGGPSTLEVFHRTCVAVAGELSANWAVVSLVISGHDGATLAGTDRSAFELNDVQFDVAEGPCFDAVDGRRSVLVSDLGGSGGQRWPAFTQAAYEVGVRAVAVFPMQVGSACPAALTVYLSRTGVLAGEAVAAGLVFADLAMEALVVSQVRAGKGQVELEVQGILDARLGVSQAQGMVMADLEVTAADALALLRANAFSRGQPLTHVAADVLGGRLRLKL